jgi:3-phosphoshikimate 1-carboxyvinyltransferase
MMPWRARPAAGLVGEAPVPGDKSISHRALMLGASAIGTTTISGLLEAADVLATARAMRQLGASVERLATPAGITWRVQGRGVGGLDEPASVLDMGNSGTGARLVLGLLASHPFLAIVCGDASLSARPMRRVIEPLSRIGAQFWARRGDRLPLAMTGASDPLPIEYRLPVASAQVKSAILLAAVNAPGVTTVIEPEPTRDHSERMLRHFGAKVEVETLADGGRAVRLEGYPELCGRPITVPGDPSSAAFPVVAALTVPGSQLRIANVGFNPLRTGLYQTLREMGADITAAERGDGGEEPVADLVVRAGPLHGVTVPAERAPSMIDEYPILAVAAAHARGRTRMLGLGELKVKESNRLAAIAAGLTACGVRVDVGDDWLEVEGAAGPPPGGGIVATHYDHRIAMAFLVLGLGAREAVTIDDGEAIATSFPEFIPLMRGLGAGIEAVGTDSDGGETSG